MVDGGTRFQMGGRSGIRCQMGMALNRFHWKWGTMLGRVEKCMGLGQARLNRLGREDRLGLSLVDLEYRSGLGYRL